MAANYSVMIALHNTVTVRRMFSAVPRAKPESQLYPFGLRPSPCCGKGDSPNPQREYLQAASIEYIGVISLQTNVL